MPTFRSKEIVDARQFIGGIDNAKELVDWFKAHSTNYRSSELKVSESRAMLGATHPVVDVPAPRLSIFLGKHPRDWTSLWLGPTDWLVLKQDGRFVVMFDESFKKKFEQV
ncbi:hypothetical protein SEA_SLOOPYJOE_68 [Arthrobacter phage Sloopyjoe]|nr:hypothetical protein PBI_SHIBA_67 [Arthrobacter phage Shiba]QFG14435.1 hypothetical protein PBI_STARLORD_68 [Arthrobacter phage StarLord]WAB09484.1 hypothetical protein SEA_SLOOPYJOE_68 [Arthrobacter phage Sloopyjoe]